jgi:hypothetical protein
MADEPANPVRCEARVAWDEGDLESGFETKLTQATVSGDTILLDWPEFMKHPTRTKLTRVAGSRFEGSSVWAPGTNSAERATVEGVLYSNEFGHMLVGQEKWENGKVDWFVIQITNLD